MIARAYKIPGTAYVRAEVVSHGAVVWSHAWPSYLATPRVARMWASIRRDTYHGRQR